MKREWAIVGAVLVPFAVLVAAGFYFSPEPVFVAPVPVAVPVLPAAPLEPLGPHPDPLPKGEGTAPVRFPPELEAPLSAVMPEVRRCFADQRFKAGRQVKVRFTPTRAGGFEKVEVDEQNPYLAACLEDVFAEVAWHPDGRQTFAPAGYTFSFEPSPD